jgi:hypothetical protein
MRITIDTERKTLEVESSFKMNQLRELFMELDSMWFMDYGLVVLSEPVPEEGYVIGRVESQFNHPSPTSEPFFDHPNSQILNKI